MSEPLPGPGARASAGSGGKPAYTNPLTRLRTGMGLSQPEYAKLIARTHGALALGQLAARRELVARWESGRAVPVHTVQLAMAHVHDVPAREVHRLGWPHWLHLVGGGAAPLDQPYTDHGAVLALRAAVHPPGSAGSPELGLSGRALADQLGEALRGLAEAGRPDGGSPPEAPPQGREAQLRWIEARTSALEQHERGTLLPPTVLYRAAEAEHRLVVDHLLAGSGGGPPAPRRLFPLAARTALLCTWLSSAVGEETRAERHNLAALRAAVASGRRTAVATVLAQLATRHLLAGDAADARTVVRAARAADPRPEPVVAALLLTREALALARLGRPAEAARALDHAADALASSDGRHRPGFPFAVDGRHLAVTRAESHLLAGAPDRAEPHLAALLDELDGPEPVPAPPLAGRMLLLAVDTYLALGRADQAARATHCAITLTGALPPGLARQYHRRLAAHQHAPVIRGALERLADAGP
ncbi:hypothetical protein [Kitasatospora sp. NPDC089509]|uniref:hypothetical protein n=1 Tax=Kitasatospora sp. NPDC089509 TaxID=3364079 RepID=UPI0037FC3C32